MISGPAAAKSERFVTTVEAGPRPFSVSSARAIELLVATRVA